MTRNVERPATDRAELVAMGKFFAGVWTTILSLLWILGLSYLERPIIAASTILLIITAMIIAEFDYFMEDD